MRATYPSDRGADGQSALTVLRSEVYVGERAQPLDVGNEQIQQIQPDMRPAGAVG